MEIQINEVSCKNLCQQNLLHSVDTYFLTNNKIIINKEQILIQFIQ